jgi:hypothetical protein
MAGSTGTLSGRRCERAGLTIAAGMLFALCPPLFAGEGTGDVVIFERPENLVVLNRYQQRLGPEEYRRLLPYVPMVIVRAKDHLGDGFTPCAAVEIWREQYFLQREEDGAFSSRGDPGKSETFRDVSLSGDTVVLLRGKALSARAAGTGKEFTVKSGTRAFRFFEHGSRTYARIPADGGRFCWVDLSVHPGSAEWREVERVSPGGGSVTDIFPRIQAVVDGANASLRRVYSALSRETGSPHAPPSFRLSKTPREFRCGLEPSSLSEAYGTSTRALLADIERVLGGTGLHAAISDGAILIPHP